MPLKDGTGPEGKGPLTGRKLGKCLSEEKKETEGTAERIVENILGE